MLLRNLLVKELAGAGECLIRCLMRVAHISRLTPGKGTAVHPLFKDPCSLYIEQAKNFTTQLERI